METLSPKVFRFGCKGIIAYDRETYKPIGFAEVVASGGLELTGEMVSLQGGSNRYTYDNAHGYIEPKMTVTVKEFPSWMYTLMLGVTPTLEDLAGDKKNGGVINIQNRKGTSLYSDGGNVFTGVTVTSSPDLKIGRYTVELVEAGKIAVYAQSDVDAGEGSTVLTLFSDRLKIHDDTLTLSDSTNIPLPQIGVSLTVGSDVSGAVVGDTFTFEVLPKAKYIRRVTLGKNSDRFPVFGMYFITENTKGSSLMMLDCFKCKANGLSQVSSEKSWSETELSIMPVIDGNRGVCEIVDTIRE